MAVTWLEYNNKKILLVDYTGLILEKDLIKLLHSVPPYLTQAEGNPILAISDLTGCFLTPGFLNAAKKMDKELFSKYQIRQAILGITGSKAILLKGFNLLSKNKIVPFNDKTEALNYLTKS